MFELPTKKNADIKALLPDLKLPGESTQRGALAFMNFLLLVKFSNF